jgi:outer membrane lipoprotein SlyB
MKPALRKFAMETHATSRVVGIFEDQQHAIEATRALLQAGFSADQVVLLAQNLNAQELTSLGIKVQHGAEEGAIGGALVGGAIGAAVGALTLLIPVAGPVAVAILAIVTATGAATGSVVGPFIGMEMTEAEAHEHAEHISKGRTVVVVRAPDRAAEAQAILVEHGSYDFSMATD